MSSVRVGIACEDNGHFAVATRLVDDTLIVAHAWMDDIIASCRSWHGLREGEHWYKYDPADAYDLRAIEVDGQRIAPQGHIAGAPLKPEAAMWRKVLLLFCHAAPRPDVVILVRDLDGYPDRRDGLNQVRNGLPWPFKIVAATAQPEIEAWRVSGFVPATARERGILTQVRSDLSFDPTTESHRLTSHPNDAATDAKRVLDLLCDSNQERHDACLVDLSLLCSRGATNGVRAFLDEVDEHIVPLFGRT